MRSVTPFLSSDRLPEKNVLVIVAGGTGYWTGVEWRTTQDDRPITWPVRWWMPFPQDKDVLDFNIIINGQPVAVPKGILRTDEICDLAGRRQVRDIQVILRERWANRIRTTQWCLYPGEIVEIVEGMEFIVD